MEIANKYLKSDLFPRTWDIKVLWKFKYNKKTMKTGTQLLRSLYSWTNIKYFFLICPHVGPCWSSCWSMKNVSWINIWETGVEVIQYGLIDTMSWVSQANWIFVSRGRIKRNFRSEELHIWRNWIQEESSTFAELWCGWYLSVKYIVLISWTWGIVSKM